MTDTKSTPIVDPDTVWKYVNFNKKANQIVWIRYPAAEIEKRRWYRKMNKRLRY